MPRDINDEIDAASKWPKSTTISVAAIYQILLGFAAAMSLAYGLDARMDSKIKQAHEDMRLSETYITRIEFLQLTSELRLKLSGVDSKLVEIVNAIKKGNE